MAEVEAVPFFPLPRRFAASASLFHSIVKKYTGFSHRCMLAVANLREGQCHRQSKQSEGAVAENGGGGIKIDRRFAHKK